jgi:eukaryotic-like serine/threonine-protein kinase
MVSQVGSQSIAPGTVLAGKYRVDRVLGQGGMGIVLAVRHLELQEDFAIKLMQGREFANSKAVERFLREARAAVRLRSKTEHIVQVHDVGRIDSGEPYIVMELLSGQDLSDFLMERGVLPISEACTYITQAGNALDAAHQLGIIHRDLKPANLFRTQRRNGSPCIKVLDFGISKHVATSEDSNALEITGTQDVMGSPLYMSPELAKAARNATPRSDIWALGAILYKLLTGRAPFQSPSPPEIFAELLGPQPAPKPSQLRADIPPELDAIIMKSIEKSAELRYATVNSFIDDLAPFTRYSSSTVVNENLETGVHPRTHPEIQPPAQEAKKMRRRPSLVETLPPGFELQPPPTPPVQPSLPALVNPRSASPSAPRSEVAGQMAGAATIPTTTARSIAPLIIMEATGSTWGTTQSRLATPRKFRNALLAGLAGTLILVLGLMTVRIMSADKSAASRSPEVTTSTRPINAETAVQPEVRVIEPVIAPAPSASVARVMAASANSETIMAPSIASNPAKVPIAPQRTFRKLKRGQSSFEDYK